MSTKAIVPPKIGYRLLKLVVLGFAAVALLSHVYYWYGVFAESELIPGLSVAYGQTAVTRADSGLDFVLTTLGVALMIFTLIYAYKLIGSLQPDEPDYSDVIRQLARFATALCLYAVGSVFAIIIMSSLDVMAQTGEFGIALMVDINRVTLLIISLVLFMVTKALHAADAAVEETQNFL